MLSRHSSSLRKTNEKGCVIGYYTGKTALYGFLKLIADVLHPWLETHYGKEFDQQQY